MIDALLDSETRFPVKYLKHFSDLDQDRYNSLKDIWELVEARRRHSVLEDLEDLGLKDTLLSFEELAKLAIADKEPGVRTTAARILWEFDSIDLAAVFIQLLEQDTDPDVRAAAASGLGKFVYAGELDRLSEETCKRIEDCLLETTRNGETELEKQKALESLGFSNRDYVNKLIEEANASTDSGWVASSLQAMGHSANEHWVPNVIKMLDDREPAVRAAAAFAVGELEVKNAVPLLGDLLDDPNMEVRHNAINALSQIGGDRAREILERLHEKSGDPDIIALLDDALENIEFWEDIGELPFLNVPDDEFYE